MRKDEPSLCPDCPLKSLLQYVKRESWTRQPENPSAMQICRRLRAEARKWPRLSCPYYKNESLVTFMSGGAVVAWVHRINVDAPRRILGLHF